MTHMTDYTYEQAHRKASEAIIDATATAHDRLGVLASLYEAERMGRKALDLAENPRQVILSTGLLQTVFAMRVIMEQGIDFHVVRSSNGDG